MHRRSPYYAADCTVQRFARPPVSLPFHAIQSSWPAGPSSSSWASPYLSPSDSLSSEGSVPSLDPLRWHKRALALTWPNTCTGEQAALSMTPAKLLAWRAS